MYYFSLIRKETLVKKMSELMYSKNAKGIMLAIVSGICWGLSGTVGQFLFSQKDVSADWISVVRMLVTGVILLAVGLGKKNTRQKFLSIFSDKKDTIDLILFSIFGLMMVQYSYMVAISYSNSGITTAIQYTGEAMVLVVVCIGARRLPSLKELSSVILAICGIFLLATHLNPEKLAISSQGLLWAIISAVGLMLYTVLPAKLSKKYGSTPIVAWGMLFAGICLFFIVKMWTIPYPTDAVSLFCVAIIILLGTLAGFGCYVKSITYIGSLKAGLFASIETIAAPFFACVWLKTTFVGYDYLGFACILIMVVMMSMPEKHRI